MNGRKRTKDKPVENSEETYVASYFCFIQSSGMGKSKLMYEFAQLTRPTLTDANEDENNTCKDISCDLILSGDILLEKADPNKNVFDRKLDFRRFLRKSNELASDVRCGKGDLRIS
jgi:hypothetical protein